MKCIYDINVQHLLQKLARRKNIFVINDENRIKALHALMNHRAKPLRIYCGHCQTELVDYIETIIKTSKPFTRNAACPGCGYTTYTNCIHIA